MRYPTVTRYVGTYVRDGQRQLMNAAQGRYTFATAKEAHEWIDAVTSNHVPGYVLNLWGTTPNSMSVQ